MATLVYSTKKRKRLKNTNFSSLRPIFLSERVIDSDGIKIVSRKITFQEDGKKEIILYPSIQKI